MREQPQQQREDRRGACLENGVGAELDHLQQLVTGCVGVLLHQAALLNDQRVEVELRLGALDNLLLNRIACHEPIHHNLLLLAYKPPDRHDNDNNVRTSVHRTQLARGVPMRCARSMACRSICGFQSLSNRMTVSAVARLMPKPPARVDSRKQNCDPTRQQQRSERTRMTGAPFSTWGR